MKRRFGLFKPVFLILLAALSLASENQPRIVRGEYFGQAPPGLKAELFGDGILSTGLPELNTVFFPGGKEVIFSVQYGDMKWALVMTREENGRWLTPEVAPFSGEYGGVDPFVSFDGNRVYFCSNRPVEQGGPVKADYDIWYVDRTSTGWGKPVHMEPPINSDAHEFYPTLTRNGTMYFQSRRSGGVGSADIYRAELVEGKYAGAECLPEPVNSSGFEGDALIAPDESYIIVSTTRGPGPIAPDLFISFRTAEGKWTEPVNMGPDINGPGGENCQMLSPCGKYLFFTSRRYMQDTSPPSYEVLKARFNQSLNGQGDSFWVDSGIIEKFRPSPEPSRVFSVLEAIDAAAKQPLWPGFNPSTMPIAVFDGDKTYLVRHPSPPPEFSPVPNRPGILVFDGQYPAVVANSTRDIGGLRTGTVLALPGKYSRNMLSASLEEMFHAFWLPHHPSLRPNEMARYVYPIDQPKNLALLLGEDEALARAIEAGSEPQAAAWAITALRLRSERTASLPDEIRDFEDALETMEGTANFLAGRATGETAAQTAKRLRRERPADGIRWRFYDSGTALCMLLNRFMPDWKTHSEEEPALTLGMLTSTALSKRTIRPATFSPAESAGFRHRAAKSIAGLNESRRRLRADVLARPGARVIIRVPADADTLRVDRFDPINLSILDRAEVVHANYLTLKSDSASVDVNNRGFVRGSFAGTVSLTEPEGVHPIRDGVRQVTIVGIREDPSIKRENGAVMIEAPEIHASLKDADVQVNGRTVTVTLASHHD
jgi:hypothetical protein